MFFMNPFARNEQRSLLLGQNAGRTQVSKVVEDGAVHPASRTPRRRLKASLEAATSAPRASRQLTPLLRRLWLGAGDQMCRWSSACSRCCSANQPVQGIFSGYRRMACFAPGVGKHKMHVPEFLASTMYAAMTHSFRLNHVARVHARTVLRAAATAEGLPTRAPTAWSILWHPWCRRSLRSRGLPSHICECNAGRMAHFSPIT